jgi:hypothetical protein
MPSPIKCTYQEQAMTEKKKSARAVRSGVAGRFSIVGKFSPLPGVRLQAPVSTALQGKPDTKKQPGGAMVC